MARTQGSNQRPLTAKRKQAFLDALRRTGNFVESAREASPHSTGKQGAVSTFKLARQADPEFAAQCQEALDECLDHLEGTIMRRAREGALVERITDKEGNTRERWQHDFRREQAVLARYRPEWRPHREVSQTSHTTIDANATVNFDPTPLAALSKAGRSKLRGVLEELVAGQAKEVPAIEAQTTKPPDPIRDATLRLAPALKKDRKR